MMETKIYQGYLREQTWGEALDILYLVDDNRDPYKTSEEDPLAEILEADIANKYVSARYYITNKQCTVTEAEESFIKWLVGEVETDVGAHYSEITGYLWTDEEINIGGHDLINELHGYLGKYLILIIDIFGLSPRALK